MLLRVCTESELVKLKLIGNLGLFVNISVMEYAMELAGYAYDNKVHLLKVRVDC